MSEILPTAQPGSGAGTAYRVNGSVAMERRAPVTSNSGTTGDLTGARRFPRVSTLTFMDLVAAERVFRLSRDSRGRLPVLDGLAVLRRDPRALRRGPRPRSRSWRPGLLQHAHDQRLHHRVRRLRRHRDALRVRSAAGIRYRRRLSGCSWRRRSTSSPAFSTASRRAPRRGLRISSGRWRASSSLSLQAASVRCAATIGEELVDKIARGREHEADCREHARRRRGSRRRNRRRQTPLRRGNSHVQLSTCADPRSRCGGHRCRLRGSGSSAATISRCRRTPSRC